jgi:hypothetical protein
MRLLAGCLVCGFLGAGYALGVAALHVVVTYLQSTAIGG